jgi:HPt (histidine-containing phosphotransfer) domain-containing protein
VAWPGRGTAALHAVCAVEAAGTLLHEAGALGPHPDGTAASADGTGACPLDGTRIAALATEGADFHRELDALFLTDAASRLSAMGTAVDRGGADTVIGLAEDLRDSAETLGAVRMGDACRLVEAQARSGNLAGVPAALEILRYEFGRARRALGELSVRQTIQVGHGRHA